MENQVAVVPQNNQPAVQQNNSQSLSVFGSIASFESWLRMARVFAESDIVPKAYQGKIGNCLVAIDIANRIGVSPMSVMQNLDIIHGNPSWRSQYAISAINSCGKYAPLQFEIKNLGPKKVQYTEVVWENNAKKKQTKEITIQNMSFRAYTKDKQGRDIDGPTITIEMAVLEGWYTKDGSKWTTMPELMGRYRAAKFFANVNCPEVLNGMMTQDEVEDTQYVDVTRSAQEPQAALPQGNAVDTINASLRKKTEKKQEPAAAVVPVEEPATVVTETKAQEPAAEEGDDLL